MHRPDTGVGLRAGLASELTTRWGERATAARVIAFRDVGVEVWP